MPDSISEQIEKLQAALAALQAQRPVLGDVIEPALSAAQEKLQALRAQVPQPLPADERRQITLFFSDVVGSVTLAESLDPEDWRAVIGAVQHKIGTIVTAHGGMIAQYQGDGLIAFFGAQGLREQDVEQAVLAALQAQAAIPQLALAVPVEIRIGIHTGLVLLGAWGAESKIEFAAFGDAVNTAARLQSNAPAGTVLISRDTYQYIRGAFEFTPLRPLVLKGKSAPVQTYLVQHAKPRVERSTSRGVPGIQTRTIGRDTELQQLREAYLEAFELRRVVWTQLNGEAGVGKSRLVDEMNAWIERQEEPTVRFFGRAFAGEQYQPFALVRRMWFDYFQIAEDMPLAAAQVQWVERFCALTGIAAEEPAHVLGLLMGLPFEHSPHLAALRNDPQQLRGRAFVVSRAVLRTVRSLRLLTIVLEDLHWADASSLDYLDQVLLPGADGDVGEYALNGVFVLGTARPEWDGLQSRELRQIPLEPLTARATQQLAHELLKNVANMPDDVVQLIVERAEGVPYFAEELVNYFLDRGIIDRSSEPWRFDRARLVALHGGSQAPLPATLQYLLRARLDSLQPSERNALQRGAIYGRQFWSGGLGALGVPEGDRILPPLEPRGFVSLQSESTLEGENEWLFHHALLRDVAYDSVLKRERPALHSQAGEWLEHKAQESDRLDEFAGVLGEHRERAGELVMAAEWYLRAGERARKQSAMREGRRFFDRALDLLPPADRERRWRALVGREATLGRLGERDLQQADIQLLLDLAETFDDDARRAEASYSQARFLVASGDLRASLPSAERALEASKRAGARALQAYAMSSIMASCTRLGDLERARALAHTAGETARACDDDFTYAQTLMQIGLHYTDAGDLDRAIEPFVQAAEIARRIGNRALEGQDLSNLGYAYAQLGLYALAREVLEKTLELAEAVGERRDYAYGLQNLGWTHLCSGDARAARQLEEQAVRDFAVLGDAFGRAASVLYLGHIAERAGELVQAEQQFSAALAQFSSIGVRGFMMDCTAGLARCALAQNKLDEAHQNAARLWEHIQAHGTAGIEQPSLVYQTCANVSGALGDVQSARLAVEQGYRELVARADKITNTEWRESFLVNVPEHRAMVEMWQASGGRPNSEYGLPVTPVGGQEL